MAPCLMSFLERRPDFGIALWRPEAHNNVFRAKNTFHPGPKQHREVQCRQRTLAHDHGMNKLNRDMLSIGGVRPAPEGEQTASAQKPLRHLAACFR